MYKPIRSAAVIDGRGHHPPRTDVSIAGGCLAALGDAGKSTSR
jgi:N-acyl-D-aspartate/D-glutamate deacylase